MDSAGKIKLNEHSRPNDPWGRLFTIRLQLALYAYIIIIRLLQTIGGNEISS